MWPAAAVPIIALQAGEAERDEPISAATRANGRHSLGRLPRLGGGRRYGAGQTNAAHCGHSRRWALFDTDLIACRANSRSPPKSQMWARVTTSCSRSHPSTAGGATLAPSGRECSQRRDQRWVTEHSGWSGGLSCRKATWCQNRAVKFIEIEGGPSGDVFVSVATIARVQGGSHEQHTTVVVLVDGTTYPVVNTPVEVLGAIALAETSDTTPRLTAATQERLRDRDIAAHQAAEATAQREEDRCPSPKNGHRHLWKPGPHPHQCALCERIEDWPSGPS